MEQYKNLIDELTVHFGRIPAFKKLSEKTGIQEGQLVVGIIVSAFLLVLIGLGTNLIVNMVGIIYPAYASFKAIESKETDDDKLWLTYWVVFAVYNFADRFIDYLFFWVPCYFLIKLCVLVYMFFPKTRGAIRFYDLVGRPIFKAYEARIDSAIDKINSEISKAEGLKSD